ncbi:type IV secretory system conjugative DNA transfer family protein [Tunicatimonas pelagia]|uniref:type IV secretory system conjugative DNA transfer family protein n=1 Tax=Tunicatimonas pelagia TaxID=931531 RepID=UPI00266548AC|nr:type IV secretory system conjugative DNA transfer family protein [Tunicatimonas pelagia]WKN46511.1 type IV secretion system DNA-binding domain-containing protein [Tunicatimonas pelagia]
MIGIILLAAIVFFASRMNIQYTVQNMLKYGAMILVGLVVLGLIAEAIDSLVGLNVVFSAALLNAAAYYYYLVDQEKDIERWYVKYAGIFIAVVILSVFVINLFARFVREDYETPFAYTCFAIIACLFPAKMLYAFIQEYGLIKFDQKPSAEKKVAKPIRREQPGQKSYYDIMGTTPEEVAKLAKQEQNDRSGQDIENAFEEYQKSNGTTSAPLRQLSLYFDTDQGEITIDNATEGVLWTGSAGAGKTKSGIEPSIYQAIRQGTAGLIYDRKGELAAHVNSAHMMFEPETDFKYINFADLNRSHRCNPLKYMRNSTDAQAFALVVLKNLNRQSKHSDPFWEGTAFSVLASTMWYLKKHHSKFCTIPHLISFLVSTPVESVVEMLKSDPETRIMFSGVEKAQGSEKTMSLIWSSVLIALGKIATRENFYLLSKDEVDLTVNHEDNRRFITVSSFPQISQHQSVAPLIALIINASYSTMYAKQNERRVPTLLQLDEFPTIYLHRFNEVPATIRSSGVCTMIGIQTLPQMIEMFGREETDAIIDNLSYQFYGKINNEETARKVSKLVGDYDKRMKVTSKSKGRSRGDFQFLGSTNKSVNESETIQRRQIIEAQEVRALNKGQFIGFISGEEQAKKVQFEKHNYSPIELDKIKDVTEKDIAENFELVNEEALMIYKG